MSVTAIINRYSVVDSPTAGISFSVAGITSIGTVGAIAGFALFKVHDLESTVPQEVEFFDEASTDGINPSGSFSVGGTTSIGSVNSFVGRLKFNTVVHNVDATTVILSAASIVGSANLTVIPTRIYYCSVGLIGEGECDASGQRRIFSTTNIVGAAAITAIPTRTRFTSTGENPDYTLTGTAIISVTHNIKVCTVSIGGVGVVTLGRPVILDIVGSADIFCHALRGHTFNIGSFGITGQGVLFAKATFTYRSSGSLHGTSNVLVTPTRTRFSSANLVGVGDLIVPENGAFKVRFPIIHWLIPDFASSGSPDVTVQILGEYFDSVTVIQWVQSPPVNLETTYVSDEEVSCVVPRALLVTAAPATMYALSAVGLSNGKSFDVTPGKPVIRLGDISTGHVSWPPRPNDSSSTDVFANNIGITRLTDHWMIHCNPVPICHDGVSSAGAPNVFVNNLAMVRRGDAISCGDRAAAGSPDVFCGDS